MKIPSFISKDITVGQVLSISRVGCNNTNQPGEMILCSFTQVMAEHAESIQDELEASLDEAELISGVNMSFEDICEKFINNAVQAWAHSVVDFIGDHSMNIKMVDVRMG